MTNQQPQQIQVRLTAIDIANAIMEQEMTVQALNTYLAGALKNAGGSITVPVSVFEELKDKEWEISYGKVGEDALQFDLLEGKALMNKKLGRSPSGLVTP